jgi:uncharacterized protein (DUF983 family)
MSEPIPPLKVLLGRGARCKCPQCGQGALYRGWFKLRDRCPVCGLQYLENQGDLWGFLLLADRALFLFPIVVMIYLRISSANPLWFYLFGSGLILVFIFTMPNRNGMSLAVDYLIRRKSENLP